MPMMRRVFLNPNKNEVEVLMRIIEKFGKATELKINVAKSSVSPIKCQEINLEDVLQPFQGQQQTFPITYLGLPLTTGRLRLIHLQPLQDRARAKLASWQGKMMNIAGRRELVRSVLSSLPTYLLTVLKPPKQFLKDIKMQRRFLWAGQQELHGGKCKVAWVKVTKPIKYGGLGVKNLKFFGRALRLRWLWYSWTQPQRPWTGTELPIDETDIALFNAATKVTIHNGKKALFWTSSWLHGTSPAAAFPNLYKHSKRKKGRWLKQ